MLRTIWTIYRTALGEAADVYQFHDPELIPVGLALRAHGHKVIYDVHEDVPRDVYSKDWIPRLLRGALSTGMRLVEFVAGRALDGIVTVTPPIAQRFPAHKTHLVQNFPTPEEAARFEGIPYDAREPRLVYAGGITHVRGIREMVAALNLIADQRVRFTLLGEFDPPALRDDIAAMPGFGRVDHLGVVGRDRVVDVLSRVRIGLSVLHPIDSFLVSQPIKLYEYMMAGIPFVASDIALWRSSIGNSECGLFVDPRDPQAIAAAVQWLLDHPREAALMGARGRALVLEKLNWGREISGLMGLYSSLRK
jgi:glycosyltransferase involved in cell wall biosynthesis